jgi:putative hydrolase of the HAD superfamily
VRPESQRIRGVVFDFYGTLVEEEDDELRWDREIFRSYGYELTDDLSSHWIDPVNSLEHLSFSTGREMYTDWQRQLWHEALQANGIAEDHIAALVEHATTRTRERRFKTYPGAAYVLEAIGNTGRRTAICSNWGWDLAEAVEACGLSGLVEEIVGSAQVGYRKPHTGIFEVVLDRLDLRADEVLFVGDTWSADIVGALSSGLWAAQVVRGDVADSQTIPPARVIQIADLAELLPLLGHEARS